jgi:hypothetical protein
MRLRAIGRVAVLAVPLSCANGDGLDEIGQATHQRQTIRIGALVDDASPAKANFTAAAELAQAQLNGGLRAAGSKFRVEVLTTPYAAGQAQSAAITLVNASDVHGLVSDISGNTAAVNRLNYESPSRIAHKVPVTCYQCSSAFFNDPSQSDPGFADPDNWLFRTFFNATFESAVQVQLVLNRPALGDFNGDGYLKIVVYYDAFHLSAATTMPAILDSLHDGPHSVELIAKTLPSTEATRAAELAAVFDTGPDGHLPDAIYLAFLPQNAPEALGDYTSFAVAARPPAQANNGVRRDFLLPSLLPVGGEGLEGSSVRQVASSPSGRLFLSAFEQAAGERPELTASFFYDAVVAQALAALTAGANGSLDPELIRGSFISINDPEGKLIRPRVGGFARAARRIEKQKAINYDGASSPLDLTALGEMYPDLVHWKITGGQFVELEGYLCDPDHPNCSVQP